MRQACLALMGVCMAAAPLPTTRVLPASVAVEIAQAAVAACRAQGAQVAVAIAEPSGEVRVLIADDGVKAIDVESARRKARTAAILAAPTLAIAAQATAAPAFAQILQALDPALFLVGGGLPITAGGDLIGAVGVGGAAGGDRDQACARAGLDAVRGRLH